MPSNDVVTIGFNRISAQGTRLATSLQRGLTAVAYAIEQRAKYLVVEQDAVDTGALLNSIYIADPHVNQRDTAIAEAEKWAATEGQHSGMSHEFNAAEEVTFSGERYWAKTAVAADYGVFVEVGTPRMLARPYLTPAAESVRSKAASIVTDVMRDGGHLA